ncbi:MAG: hypothetical protein FGM15_06940 [Chthoniobacterales bacterium]|nr:hypothetical protein [Chthoniobacterales bacterium]
MNQEDRKLWDLLGRSPRHPAPPFFAAKVMRRIGEAGAPRTSWFAPIFRWLAPAAIAALVVLAIAPRPDREPASVATSDLTTLDLLELLSPEDYQILTDAGWPYNDGFLSADL